MAENADPATKPWRRRHPVLSRVVLYVAGAVLVTTLVLAWKHRRAQDRLDRLQFLEARLEQLDILNFSVPEGRAEARRVLQAEYADPELPPTLRARALRLEAGLDGRDGQAEAGLAKLDAAAALQSEPAEAYAIDLERATLLQLAGRGADARTVLAGLADRDVGSPTLELHRAMTLAWVRAEAGEAEGAAADLRAAIRRAADAWTLTPEEVAPTWVGPVRPRAVDAAIQATRLQCGLAPCAPGDWTWLVPRFPDSYAAHEAAALGLLEGGDLRGAAELWTAARRLDPEAAAAREALSPDLRALREKFEDQLQPADAPGR